MDALDSLRAVLEHPLQCRSMYRFARSLVLFIALSLSFDASAGAKEAIRLGKLTCVLLRDGFVYPLSDNDRIDQPAKIRCTVGIVFTADTPQRLPLTMTLEQASESAGGKPVRATTTVDLQLSSGNAEIEVALPDELNGCMPYSVSVSLSRLTKKKTFHPDCGEG